MHIRSLALAGAAALAICTAGFAGHAADYPVLRGSQIEEMPSSRDFSSGPNWGGFYFGGTAGYATGQFDSFNQSENLAQAAFRNLVISDPANGLLRFGKASHDKVAFGGFAGFNMAFGDAVLGVEAEYLRVNLQTDQRGSIGRSYMDLFPTTIPSAPNVDPVNTNTAVVTSGHSTNKIDDLMLLKARAGYAFGNFMPFANIGLAVGRISTNAEMQQAHRTTENYAMFNTVTTGGSVTRTTYAGPGSIARPDASGAGSANAVYSGYVPGLALGVGLDALLAENVLLRAEVNRIYFSEYKGVRAIVDTARVGAGIKF